MALSIVSVNTSTDPWGTVITRVNECANAFTFQALTANNNANGAFVTGNSYVFGIFGANTLTVFNALRGGNVQTGNVLTISSNVAVTGSLITTGNSTVNTMANSTAFLASNLTANAVLSFSGLLVGGNVGANATAFYVGNSTVKSISNSSLQLWIGATGNASLSATTLSIGNSTVNALANSSLVSLQVAGGIANLSASALTIGTSFANSTAIGSGANVYANTSAYFAGNSSVNGVFSATSIVFGGNATLNSTAFSVGNSSVNVVINSSAVAIAGANLVTAAQRDSVAWANSLVGSQGRINFLQGNNVFLNITNDTAGGQINVQINAVATSGAAIVGGGDQSVQFNDGGNFNGDNVRMSFVRASSILTVANTIVSNIFQVSTFSVISGNSAAFVNSVGVDTIDAFTLTSYRAAEYIYSIKNNGANGYQSGKLMMLQDGANAYVEEYGVTYSNTLLGAFNGYSNATHALLQFTPTSNISYTVTFTRNSLAGV